MSFAADTKKELTQLESKPCCARSELAALIRMNGSISFGNRQLILNIPTEHAAIARRIYTLIKRIYNFDVELLVRKKMRLKKNNVYIVRVSAKARDLLEDLGIMDNAFTFTRVISKDFTKKSCCKRSYLRGAFLAGGSINHPETSYHLEIFSMYEEHTESLCNLMNEFGLNAKMLERKKGYIVYIKEGEKITEFLSVVGAHQALLYFEDVRIMKDMRNSVNRIVNCETANLNKTVGAAFRQVENIRFIQKEVGLEILPDKLREIAELRVKHQDVTLKELGEMVTGGAISKSGINHRLRKIDQIADKLRDGKPIS
ncbi:MULTISPECIES: DNA-binding protein WhiA [Bacillales]|uniref:DNA-binding protein WhiA n=1 Tax=Bacillales TaxID=1385 RepID=UPI0018841412|nr:MULTISPECIES: DNA-binding protein WhiA [Bacillaceae]MBF0705688.1 DNA-binding protein WhiA [Pseudalkalibacillus hwajinpoensis]MDO6657904.1 DNA-binding protein WhiA [Anaerobacillus sp. 1_MG-2023]WLR61253.1 DNA-binding protein WhiA [Pseudalkalibacillus hwajinpoensis]